MIKYAMNRRALLAGFLLGSPSRAVAQTNPRWTSQGDSFMQKARETFDLSYYGRAEGEYRKALAINPKDADALAGMAWVQSGRREFEQSIEWANQALAVEPKRPGVYGLLGDAAVEMGDYESAFEHYQTMLDMRPDIASYSRGAHVLFLTGNIKKATLLMMNAIESGGPYIENTAWCRAELALMQFAEGSYLSASQVVAEGIGKAPDNFHLLAAMGKVKAGMKDFPAAIAAYEKARAIVPHHDVVVALGDIYSLQGEKAKANSNYDLVPEIHKRNRANGVAGNMPMVQFQTDHDINLVEALKMAETEYKTRPNVYMADTLAWCYYKNGRIKEALKYSLKAVRVKTPEALFLYHKGLIEAKSGEIANARTSLYQALSLSPNFHPLAAPGAVRAVQELGSRGTLNE